MQSELLNQAETQQLKTKILDIDSNGLNIVTKDLAKNTMRYLAYCNLVKNENPDFNLTLAKSIFKTSFGKLFKKQSLPDDLLNCIKEQNGKFVVDSEFKNKFLNFALNYYMKIENFDYFLIFNKTDMLILSKDQIENENIAQYGLTLTAFPSFAESAGPQRTKTGCFISVIHIDI